jgi:hypothetical protein
MEEGCIMNENCIKDEKLVFNFAQWMKIENKIITSIKN